MLNRTYSPNELKFSVKETEKGNPSTWIMKVSGQGTDAWGNSTGDYEIIGRMFVAVTPPMVAMFTTLAFKEVSSYENNDGVRISVLMLDETRCVRA